MTRSRAASLVLKAMRVFSSVPGRSYSRSLRPSPTRSFGPEKTQLEAAASTASEPVEELLDGVLVVGRGDLDPAGGPAVELGDERRPQLGREALRKGDPLLREVGEPRGLARAAARHDDGVALGLADDLQARLRPVAGVGDDVGEGGDPGDVGLPGAERLDDGRVARRDGRPDDEAGVLPHELGQLVPAAGERALLDGGDEEHPDDLSSRPLDPVAPHEAGDESEEEKRGEEPAGPREDRPPFRRHGRFSSQCGSSSPPHGRAGV